MWSWRVLPAVFWKLALQQTAQQVGHGHALREGRHLDACPHGSRDVEGQASGVDVALVERIRVALANPRLGVWISGRTRSEEHTSELQSLMRISYAVFCLKKTKII